jgi:hypothetical protein
MATPGEASIFAPGRERAGFEENCPLRDPSREGLVLTV